MHKLQPKPNAQKSNPTNIQVNEINKALVNKDLTKINQTKTTIINHTHKGKSNSN